jgi:hypothetical protein
MRTCPPWIERHSPLAWGTARTTTPRKMRDLQDIIRDIHSLEEDLLAFERKYGIRSETFYATFVSGEEDAVQRSQRGNRGRPFTTCCPKGDPSTSLGMTLLG